MEEIAFIGFGEAGQTISRGLLADSDVSIVAYDILFDATSGNNRPQQAARELGVTVLHDPVVAVREADIVFLAVTASSSLEAALSCLPGLHAGQLFLDINSVSPRRKQDTAALIAPTGASYVDVAVMAPVAPYQHKVPCLIGGPGAADLLPRAQALGMRMEIVSREVGQASAIKMFRSIIIKGLEALILEAMVAADEYSVADLVLASLKETYPTLEWEQLSGYMIERVVSHGKRRAAEMREVAATLNGIGIEPIMALATAERQQWLADLAVSEELQGRKSESRAELLAAIRKAQHKAHSTGGA